MAAGRHEAQPLPPPGGDGVQLALSPNDVGRVYTNASAIFSQKYQPVISELSPPKNRV